MTHDKHRERLKKRFLAAPDRFEDHELLELILFYAIPRKNTNETAHFLLDRFDSIKGVLDANIDALTAVDGIGENSALYIKAIAKLLSRYEFSEPKSIDPLKSPKHLALYLKNLFIGTQNEATFLLLFDSSKKLIVCEKICEGISTENTISMRKIVSLGISHGAASAILVHNHPSGSSLPSGDDILATNRIKQMLDSLGIILMEHFIIADDYCTPIIDASKTHLFNT